MWTLGLMTSPKTNWSQVFQSMGWDWRHPGR